MHSPPHIEDGKIAALEQVALSAMELLEAWDAFLKVAEQVVVSPRVHSQLVALRRDLAGLWDFHDA